MQMVDSYAWVDRLQKRREAKERFLRGDPRSPIPAEEQGGFPGLDYYPPDPEYRFRLELHEHDRKDVVRVDLTRGSPREMVRWGEFRFTLEGEEHVLQAYRSAPGEERLFVPFRDSTSRTETYEKGRYLDLEPRLHQVGDHWVLDLNEAYNPWCAYSGGYSCVIPPEENWIAAAIPAGEKRFPG